MFHEINFRREIAGIAWKKWFRTCRPKILVVTDGLNYNTGSDFGLTQFVDTLKSSSIYGMTPTVITANRDSDSTADIDDYTFDNPTNGLIISRYDVVFLFGVDRQTQPLAADEADIITTFMQAGGGVFATGDHEDLGAGMSMNLPRIKNLRFWLASETPNISNDTRLSTNLPGDNNIYEFDDQSDTHPQRLFVNYRTTAGGIGEPHPLLQAGPLGQIEVFPDHPHEGECRLPADDELATTFDLGGVTLPEWPDATIGGGPVKPEMVALSVSHGDSFPGKHALKPRSFMSIVAYDGHLANVGRISTDATWHHFVNTNIDGTGSPYNGMQDGMGNDTTDMLKIREYYKNIASWLMPKRRRICSIFPWVITEILKYPLFEELRIPVLKEASSEQLHRIGEQVFSALSHRYSQWQATSLVSDALETAIGEKDANELLRVSQDFGRLSANEAALAALGGIVTATIETTLSVKDKAEVDIDKTFIVAAEKAAKQAVEGYHKCSLKDIQLIQEAFTKIFTSTKAVKSAA